jgi:hypothetical protein
MYFLVRANNSKIIHVGNSAGTLCGNSTQSNYGRPEHGEKICTKCGKAAEKLGVSIQEAAINSINCRAAVSDEVDGLYDQLHKAAKELRSKIEAALGLYTDEAGNLCQDVFSHPFMPNAKVIVYTRYEASTHTKGAQSELVWYEAKNGFTATKPAEVTPAKSAKVYTIDLTKRITQQEEPAEFRPE